MLGLDGLKETERYGKRYVYNSRECAALWLSIIAMHAEKVSIPPAIIMRPRLVPLP